MSDTKTTELAINTIRCLAADVVQKANSGHPGMPMGMAPVAHVLWSKFLKFNPKNPKWWNRDRFVLSNGHGCALLYIMLHLSGYSVEMKDLQSFRQLGSITPGHPEKHLTPGIEVTTGPLGQGIANAVGLAIAESHLAAVFNKPGLPIFDNYTYVFLGDGCLQEGISHEACSLAGHLGLGKLIAIYDDNHITIDGDTALSFTEDVPKRFEAYGWHTLSVSGGDHDTKAIEDAIRKAKEVKDKPSIICLRTTIGFGATKQGTGGVHGEALGDAEVKKVKTKFGFDPEKKFFVPDEIRALYGKKVGEGKSHEDSWKALFGKYKEAFPKEAQELIRRFDGKFPENWKAKFPKFTPKDKAVATRQLSQDALNAAAAVLPELIGGSADLTGSNKTNLKDYPVDYQKKTPHGRYFRFGVREHGMAAIGNGLNAYGGLIPYTATFLNFIEYCFPAVRLAALSEHQQIFVMTHDSIGLGEDGPTHQPTEALSLCRATPNLLTFRPADGNETVGSYFSALEFKHGPSVLALSRQNLPHLEGSEASKVALGGYVLKDAPSPQVIFVATGSEVHLAVNAAKLLETKHGLKVRVVSMPCTELFEKQPLKYRRDTIIPGVPTISIEALGPLGWERFSHFQLALKEWGASAPLEQVMDHFGFTPAKVAASTLKILAVLKESAKEMNLSDALPLPVHFRAAL